MLYHIVMWKFKETAGGASKQENLSKAKSMLDALPPLISEIEAFEVGIDILHTEASYDLVLRSAFAGLDALKSYQVHPEHLKVVEFLRSVHESRIIVDYEAP